MFANVYCSLIVYCYSAVVDVEGVRTSARLTYNAKKLAEFAFGFGCAKLLIESPVLAIFACAYLRIIQYSRYSSSFFVFCCTANDMRVLSSRMSDIDRTGPFLF